MGIEDIKPENRIQILIGIKRAKEFAVGRIWKIGETVGYEDNSIAHSIKEINGNNVTLWIPGQEDSIKIVSIKELYDPMTAYQESLRVDEQQIHN